MRNGRNDERSPCQGDVMALLARARPAGLDPGSASRNWPTASEIIEAAEASRAGPARYGSKTRRRRRHRFVDRLAHPHRHKLVGAMMSAAVTAALIVVIIVIGTFAHRPHGRTPSSVSVKPGNQLIVFHALNLRADWRGRVAYAVRDGIVYLTGSIRGAAGDGKPIAVLPPGGRPAVTIDLVASFGAGGDGFIQVSSNGLIEAFRHRSQITFVSLAGVSFPIGSG